MTPPAPPRTGRWEYVGLGCFTGLAGLAGGAMIAVLVAKILGAARRCAPDAETGAPCNWYAFAVVGAVVGVIVVPIVSIWLRHRGRRRAETSERG